MVGPREPHPAFPRSYAVVTGGLYAGPYPGDVDPEKALEKLGFLYSAGVRAFVNLMEPHETDHSGKPFIPYEEAFENLAATGDARVEFRRHPIRDLGVPGAEGMRRILDEIDGFIGLGMPVYVHCWGGRGRTGTVVGCYLVRHGLAEGGALSTIEALRKNVPDAYLPSPETEEQRSMVRAWKNGG